MTQTLNFTVTGEQTIHCAGCEQRIDNALRRLPGVQEVEASAQTQHVRVRFDPAQINPDQVQSRLAQLGYEATPQGDNG